MTHDEPVSLPTAPLVSIALGASLVVGGVAALASLALRPEGLLAAVLGMTASGVGLTFGTLVVTPWKARPVVKWPMVLLAGHGAAMLGVLAVGALLYSATRPDPVVFLAASAAPFPIAMIGQARLVVAPALAPRGSETPRQAPGAGLQ